MGKRKSVDEELKQFHQIDNEKVSIDAKLDELLKLLEESNLDSNSATDIKAKLNIAVSKVDLTPEVLKDFEQLDDVNASRLELADNLEFLLTQYQVDSKISRKVTFIEKMQKISVLLVGLVLITLGLGMIIMPAPPYFEMFTIFWFSMDDGFTLMDLIALLIVFSGIYMFISSILKTNKTGNAQ